MSDLKVKNKRFAAGYWGSAGPWARIEADQTEFKIRAWLQDQQIARGRQATLWLPVSSVTPGSLVCTCTKVTTQSAIHNCDSCYGSGFVPGFQKFMHQTIFLSSAEVGAFTLVGTALNTGKKPNLIELASGAVIGTIITNTKPFTNPLNAAWEARVDAFVRTAGSTITTEFSTDGGGTWIPLAQINGPSKPIGSGNIQFRITLSRASASDFSPGFEILRVRRPMSENRNGQISRRRPLEVGQVLILKTWAQEKESLLEGRGRFTEHLTDRSWTMPLDFYDTSLTTDTKVCVIDDSSSQVHPILEYIGPNQDNVVGTTRYIIEQVSVSTQTGCFTHQSFVERQAQLMEVYSPLVF